MLYRNTEITCKGVSRGKVKQLVIPRELVPNVLNFIHYCATSSHPGKERAYKQAQLKYYWTDMRKQIYNNVDNCNICAEVKGHTRPPAPMLNYPIPEKRWERIHLDTLKLPLSENGYKYLLVFIDYFLDFAFCRQYGTKRQKQSLQLYLKEYFVRSQPLTLSSRTIVLNLTTLFWWKYVIFSTSRKLMFMPTNRKVTELSKDLTEKSSLVYVH